MKLNELEELRARVARILKRLDESSGAGFSHLYTFPNGETHHYRFNGVKSLEAFEDDLLAVFVWVWSMKDYLKEAAKHCGADPHGIEAIVDSSLELQLVSDIANRAKHGGLKKSRSGHFARLSRPSLTCPQKGIGKITFEAFDVTLDVSEPSEVDYKADVLSKSGATLGEATDVLTKAIVDWETRGIQYAARA